MTNRIVRRSTNHFNRTIIINPAEFNGLSGKSALEGRKKNLEIGKREIGNRGFMVQGSKPHCRSLIYLVTISVSD